MPRMNRQQRIALVVAALVIGVIQLVYFSENGIDGYGWIFSLTAITALIFLALGNERTNGTGAINSTPQQLSDISDKDLKSYVAINIKAVNELTEEANKELFGNSSAIQTNRGPMSEVMASLSRSSLLLYAFSLLVITKIRHNPAYFNTDEYKRTKELIILQCLAADTRILDESSVAAPSQKMLESFVAEVRTLEEGVRDFANQLSKGNTNTPAAKINGWLQVKTGISSVLGKSLEEFTKEKLRSIYQMIYKLPA